MATQASPRVVSIISQFRAKLETRNPVLEKQPEVALYLAVWFGMLTGVAEVAVTGFEKFVLGHYVHRGFDFIYMAPLAESILFGLTGLGLWVAIRARWLGSLRLVLFVFAFMILLSLLFMADWLDRLAETVLAGGLAWQISKYLEGRQARLFSLLRNPFGWARGRKSEESGAGGPSEEMAPVVSRRDFLLGAGATLGVLAAGVRGGQALFEWRARGALPSPSPDAPNVLLVILDTVRAANLSLYGYTRFTSPALERWANTGVRFENAFATAPWTLPSHASIFTGRYPHELSADWLKPLDAAYPTLAEILSARGYLTGGFVANTAYSSAESGLARAFAHYADYMVAPGEVAASSSVTNFLLHSRKMSYLVNNRNYEMTGRKDAARVNADLLNWVDTRDGRPFFAFLNYFDAHEPYIPPAPFAGRFGPMAPRDIFFMDSLVHTKDIPAEMLQADLNAYDASLNYIDHEFGALLKELEKRDLIANTCVVLASDHGEEFGEHDLLRHGYSVYLPSLHVPLIIAFPARVPAGRNVVDPVSLRDLPATIMHLAGIQNRLIPGESLSRFWQDSHQAGQGGPLLAELKSLPTWRPAGVGNMRSLISERYHYIRYGDGKEELFDRSNDAWEQHDLASTEAVAPVLVDMRNWLERHYAS